MKRVLAAGATLALIAIVAPTQADYSGGFTRAEFDQINDSSVTQSDVRDICDCTGVTTRLGDWGDGQPKKVGEYAIAGHDVDAYWVDIYYHQNASDGSWHAWQKQWCYGFQDGCGPFIGLH